MTLEEFKEFEKGFIGIIPKGKFQQLKQELCEKLGEPFYFADTSHDMSIVNLKTKQRHRVGTFQHADYAGYIETIVNAYRNGDLVHKDSLKELE